MGWRKKFDYVVDEFIEKLMQLREERNMSQKDLAISSGITRRMIGGYERGETHPSLVALHALADGLDCEVSEFFPTDGQVQFSLDHLEEVQGSVRKTIEALTELDEVLEATKRRSGHGNLTNDD